MTSRTLALLAAISTLLGACKKSDSNSTGGGGTIVTATITSLSCAAVTFNAVATANTAFNATATVPYAGGNGATYAAGAAISSSRVTGLTATWQAGTLANGTGNLSFSVSGTPSAAGTANFTVSFGSQTCTVPLTVNAGGATTPTITALACGSGSFSAPATVGMAYNAVATIPYNGGNGLAYTGGSAVASTGVTGLTATLVAGTLANGTGNLSYTVTGTPAAVGTASFALSFGGQNCTINLTVNNTSGGPTLPAVYNKIYGATSITFDGTWVTIKFNALPDHRSVYYPVANPLYETFSGTTFGGGNFVRNPNNIASQNITINIPVNPVVAATHAATPMGVMGVALNGIPLFNQYAAGGAPLTNEMNGFDQWWGHPQNTGMYHYHVEPKYLTTVKATKSALMGFLLDGFPVYGPEESNGSAPTGLDAYHGHTHVTADYPAGIYHYHITTAAPYINGNGFYGTPGTVIQ